MLSKICHKCCGRFTGEGIHCEKCRAVCADLPMTLASLSVAEQALRDEPYERLPFLAGTMAVAQNQIGQLRQENTKLTARVKQLEHVIVQSRRVFRMRHDAVDARAWLFRVTIDENQFPMESE